MLFYLNASRFPDRVVLLAHLSSSEGLQKLKKIFLQLQVMVVLGIRYESVKSFPSELECHGFGAILNIELGFSFVRSCSFLSLLEERSLSFSSSSSCSITFVSGLLLVCFLRSLDARQVRISAWEVHFWGTPRWSDISGRVVSVLYGTWHDRAQVCCV